MPQSHEREPVEREEEIHVDESGGAVERHETVTRVGRPGGDTEPSIVPAADEPLVEHRERIVHNVAAERYFILHKASQLIWLLVTIVDGMIALRVVLKLMAANPNNPFATFVYNFTAVFLWPFFGLTVTPSAGGVIFELSSLVAIVVYILAALVVDRLMWLVFSSISARRASTYERHRR